MLSVIKRLFGAPRAAGPPRLCVGCTHFLRHETLPDAYGYCARSGKTNLVDGKREYDHASTVREESCKGGWWEGRPNSPEDYENRDELSF